MSFSKRALLLTRLNRCSRILAEYLVKDNSIRSLIPTTYTREAAREGEFNLPEDWFAPIHIYVRRFSSRKIALRKKQFLSFLLSLGLSPQTTRYSIRYARARTYTGPRILYKPRKKPYHEIFVCCVYMSVPRRKSRRAPSTRSPFETALRGEFRHNNTRAQGASVREGARFFRGENEKQKIKIMLVSTDLYTTM